jgi:Xaa-Pro aminopeptidase
VNRRERALAIVAGRTLVSADPATVSWLTGHVPEIEWGPSPFSVPPVAILQPDGRVWIVVSDDEAGGLAADVEALTFPGFVLEDVDRRTAADAAVLSLLRGKAILAVELGSLPGSLVRALRGTTFEDVTAKVRRARAVKDEDEIEGIRAAIRAADAGQAAARAALAAGRTELELWSETRAAIEATAGGRTPVLADLVTGPRTAEVGGPPSTRRIEAIDLLLVDVVPRVGAYWGDSCATVALGDPSDAVRRAHATALEALDAAKAAVRPGVRADEIDAAARAFLPYPHHTGHGLGLTTHEEPRIVPGAERVLEAGMVVALEPGTYGDDWGVRVEQVLLVTPDGHEVLSRHDLAL